jgi:hypothetical protein
MASIWRQASTECVLSLLFLCRPWLQLLKSMRKEAPFVSAATRHEVHAHSGLSKVWLLHEFSGLMSIGTLLTKAAVASEIMLAETSLLHEQ